MRVGSHQPPAPSQCGPGSPTLAHLQPRLTWRDMQHLQVRASRPRASAGGGLEDQRSWALKVRQGRWEGGRRSTRL